MVVPKSVIRVRTTEGPPNGAKPIVTILKGPWVPVAELVRVNNLHKEVPVYVPSGDVGANPPK